MASEFEQNNYKPRVRFVLLSSPMVRENPLDPVVIGTAAPRALLTREPLAALELKDRFGPGHFYVLRLRRGEYCRIRERFCERCLRWRASCRCWLPDEGDAQVWLQLAGIHHVNYTGVFEARGEERGCNCEGYCGCDFASYEPARKRHWHGLYCSACGSTWCGEEEDPRCPVVLKTCPGAFVSPDISSINLESARERLKHLEDVIILPWLPEHTGPGYRL